MLARKYGVRLHTHLCETKDEENQCLDMYGLRPLDLMEKCGLIVEDIFSLTESISLTRSWKYSDPPEPPYPTVLPAT